MKVKISLFSDTGISLPIHYNHILRGFILRNFVNEDELLTFSNLFGIKNIKNGQVYFHRNFHFYFSSLKEPKELPLEKEFRLGRFKVFVKKVDLISEEFSGSPIEVKTLSPITVFLRTGEGKTCYFSPEDKEFYELIEEKVKSLTSELFKVDADFTLMPSERGEFRKVVVRYRNRFIVEAWKGKFLLQGQREALKVALSWGLGYRTHQGFGFIALPSSSLRNSSSSLEGESSSALLSK
ncbi:CRISPR-associated endoribonuclease Cas6 [Thermovibrio sp.]